MPLLLKVQGAGHSVEVSVADDATILHIKQAVEASTGLAPEYQRLLHRGKAFDDDCAGAMAVGIADRTKVMLMRSPAYARDQQAIEAIQAISLEIDALEARRGEASAATREEMSTQLSCKLDAVDVGDSDALRQRRRKELKRCEQLAEQTEPS
uniref:Ubiquitin-like domain-containing protein n=1 Tax=Prymnesium polylepis TaxID=72548 RepID=A0A7S4J8B3_9EUKA|mmetsp:Transcript_40682/g.101165  ORF Transcript_40682/g.101165 Transcript_40682/m.101165 type:complete len:153 (+) Transcript_40682:34-492(+)